MLIGGPFAETFAGFEAEFLFGHELLQIGRRSPPVVDRGQHNVVDRESKIGSDLICVLQRTEHGEPAAERSLDNGVDRLCVADALFDKRNGLAPQCVLQPVRIG